MESTTQTACVACNNDYPSNYVTKTTDAQWVCLACYRATCHDLGKSTLTGAEAKATKKFLRAYTKRCNKYMLAVQAFAQQHKMSPRKAMQEFIAIEQHTSEDLFKKDWTCTDEHEHFKAMECVLACFGYSNLQKGDVIVAGENNTRDESNIYATRAWYFRRREHGRSLLLDKQVPVFPPMQREVVVPAA